MNKSDSHNNLVIAIDGFSSSGKSTLAKSLAVSLNYVYVDTGAMYRAVTLHFINNNVDLSDAQSVRNCLDSLNLTFIRKDGKNLLFLNDNSVGEEIRSMEVSELVSEVAAISAVRKKLVQIQCGIDKSQGIVMDGRDIGTVVYPEAELKIFLVSDLEVRAKRRHKELIEKGQEISLTEVKKNLQHRDHIDSTRLDSPLKKAEDAIEINNSDIDILKTLSLVEDLVKKIAQ